ncbi:hypothetical protein [Aestuariivirga sp.]|uniref:hypothetical protein n=1 Tax=Aestuariivirga sp. TaxID=2650926 RepID=UPI003BABA30C
MKGSERDQRIQPELTVPVKLYCMGAMVADEASREGFRDLARTFEAALSSFLSGLSRTDQGEALRLSYEAALGDEDAAPPRLRLVYSRD